MQTIFPEEAGVSGAFLLGWRRRPGSGLAPDNIEQVMTVILKRAYTVAASDSDAALGALTARDGGPKIFEGDAPASFLDNGDFADGLAGWSTTGGAEATAVEGGVTVGRSGGAGDLRRNASFGRQLRERQVRIMVEASADAGLATAFPLLVQSATTSGDATGPAAFPATDAQPALLSTVLALSSGVTAQSLSARLPTLAADGLAVTYAHALVNTVDYESDLVAFKPEADLIVIADAPPLPISIAVNGTIRMSQEAILPLELTGLGWENRVGTTREGQGGDFTAMTQTLPDAFQNVYYNGYRRNRRQGGDVPYLQAGDQIEIVRHDGGRYAFTLPTDTPSLRHQWFIGEGADDPCLWRVRSAAMDLDTLVVEPDRNEAYAVWRAVWPIDLDPDGSGPIPLQNNRRVTVSLGGA
jgi:hypothetical protein